MILKALERDDVKKYIVCTIKPWNVDRFHETIKHLGGEWYLVTDPASLNDVIENVKPRYVFLPHWNHLVAAPIVKNTECVGFHPTDLPFGRGGSPVQNLIERGHEQTVMTAYRMTAGLDDGPIYMKRPFSLLGGGDEIFIRGSKIVASMIHDIVMNEPEPLEQTGEVSVFKRRTPPQSEIPLTFTRLEEIFNHVRMLDAEGYPKAFIQHGNFTIEFSRATMRPDGIEANVYIKKTENKDEK